MNERVAFSQLFETVPDALIVVDGDGRVVAANGHAHRLFGYAVDALHGQPIESLMPESARARHRHHRAGYMERPRVRAMGDSGQALIGLRQDGQQFPVEIALTPIGSSEGVRFLASIRDISESQRARQALIRARYDAVVARIGQLALEARDEASIVGDLPRLLAEALDIEAVAITFLRPDRSGVDVRAAHGFERAPLAALAGLGPADGPAWQTLSGGRSVADGGAAGDVDSPLANRLGMPSAGCAVTPLLDRDRPMGALIALSQRPQKFDHDALHLLGSVANMLAAFMQRRHTEEQLAHSQRLDAIGQLTGGIAHDFNNLLTIISGSLQLIEAGSDDRPETLDLVSSALRSVTRGAELTSKLLAFARRQRLSPRSIDPGAMLREMETMLRRTLGESILLKLDCPPGLPPAHADATQLDTALVNLAINARDAMPRGGEIVLAAAQVRHDTDDDQEGLKRGHYIAFSVRDTGRGMAPETLARAVEPFFTTKDVGRGSGLGLSMVYGFARQSGGHLRIQSRLGYGTSVELLLPVARTAAVSSATAAAAIHRGQGERVLVVEDEPDVRAIAESFLRSLGYQCVSVASAAEALALLKADDRIDLLFSDVMLGNGMDGNELALAARALRPQLPVMLTSGYNEARDGDEGGFEMLRKPYRREQLAAAISRQLSARGPIA
jgi:PAS domain S-box-containing protein